MLAGKTKLAKYLEAEHHFFLVQYNDLLKTAASVALSAIGVTTTTQDILDNKERYRPLLQNLGDLLGFNEGWGLPSLVDSIPDSLDVVVDNVRFTKQWSLLHERGYTLVRLDMTGWEQENRAYRMGLDTRQFGRAMQHPAERGIPPQEGELVIPARWATEEATEFLLRRLRHGESIEACDFLDELLERERRTSAVTP